MAIERWEMEMRQRGNIVGAETAKALRESYGDVPLTSLKEQPPLGIVRFTPEAQGKLVEAGYVLHVLTGDSIKTIRESGELFCSTWHHDRPDLEELSSRRSEVAVNLSQFFIPNSNRRTLKEQERMINAFSKELKIPGVEAVLGEMPDYVELAFTHLQQTGVRLLGENYGYNYTRTKTKTSEFNVAGVGGFDSDEGLGVSSWPRISGYSNVFAAPLVVPA